MSSISNTNLGMSTFYFYKAKHKELQEAIKRGRYVAIAMVEDALFENAIKGNVTAQIFYLKNRDRLNWKDKLDVEQTSKVENLTPLAEMLKLTPEEEKQFDMDEDEDKNS